MALGLGPFQAGSLQVGVQLALVQGQGAGTQFQQLTFKQQAGEVAGRATAAGQPPADLRRGHGEQAVEAVVESGIGCPGVVVEHQPDGFAGVLQPGRQGRLAGPGHTQRFAQTLTELLGRKLPATQPQPDHAGAGRRQARALAHQHRLAATGRRHQQAQAALGGAQAGMQPFTGQVLAG